MKVQDRIVFIDQSDTPKQKAQRGMLLDKLWLDSAVLLWNPKFPHNVGNALRACAAFGIFQLWFTGDRVFDALDGKTRLPREERMKGYGKVHLVHSDRPFDHFRGLSRPPTPVCIEILHSTQPLSTFVHPPDNTVYVYGQEDGSVPAVVRRHCHQFVQIESFHCLNLASAVAITLYHRRISLNLEKGEAMPLLDEFRGWSW